MKEQAEKKIWSYLFSLLRTRKEGGIYKRGDHLIVFLRKIFIVSPSYLSSLLDIDRETRPNEMIDDIVLIDKNEFIHETSRMAVLKAQKIGKHVFSLL